jgi:carotenoid cleavage dioxygenase-like enzyme
MILRNKFPTTCMTLNEKLPTLVHIYKKDVLKHVKTIEMPPFFSFHFTNGYSTHSKIVVEYVRYDIESAKNLLKFVEDTPKFTQPDFSGTYKGSSTLEELSIDLKDFTTASRSMPLDGDFPVCEPQDVGKPWPHTYAIGSSSGLLLTSDTIYKFGREKQTI